MVKTFGKHLAAACGVAALMTAAGVPALALESGDPGFGKQWVRDNPFGIQAISLNPSTWNFSEYFGAGMTLLTKDAGQSHPLNPIGRPAEYADAKWQAILPVRRQDPHAQAVQAGINEFNNWRHMPNNAGWIIGDEPDRLAMPAIAEMTNYVRQYDRSNVVYTTLGHDEWGARYLYGDESRPDYTFGQYIDDYIQLANPDVLVYDRYPFFPDGSTVPYLSSMMTIRAKAQEAGIPYWAWMQTFGTEWPNGPMGESQNRLNVFTHLTAGYTGLLYWTYDYYAGSGDGLIDRHGNRTPMYDIVRETNHEAANLGQSLRFLESTDVRFVAGRYQSGGPFTAPNAAPNGLTNWSAGAGGDPHLTGISVNWNVPGGLGSDANGMIGFFTDDDGQHYFMLTNLNHGSRIASADIALSFTLVFDSTISSIWLLNRLTGLPEEIFLNNHTLNWTLPGGTGDLFKYHNGSFAGIVPEPGGAVMLLLGMAMCSVRTNRRP